MKFTRTTTLLASCLALAACGDGEADTAVADPAATPAETAEYDPMTRDYTLSAEAQARRDEFDAGALETEYATYREEIRGEQVRMGEAAGADGEMTEEDRSELEAASQQRDATTNMRTRANMTWSYLDRNDDNRLSVAEYAIWAIPLDPNAPARNDEAMPYLTADQANTAADSFFYYDIDGDTYLSQREFTAARRGETIPA